MIYFQKSTEGDWCRAIKEGTVIYDGHNVPGPLLRAVLAAAGIRYEEFESDKDL